MSRSAQVFTLKKHGRIERIPVFVTHDKAPGSVHISKGLQFKAVDESWLDYCRRLWIGTWEENGTDMIKLTVHLKLSESHRMMNELNRWYGMVQLLNKAEGGIMTDLIEERMGNLEIHGVRFKFDAPE